MVQSSGAIHVEQIGLGNLVRFLHGLEHADVAVEEGTQEQYNLEMGLGMDSLAVIETENMFAVECVRVVEAPEERMRMRTRKAWVMS